MDSCAKYYVFNNVDCSVTCATNEELDAKINETREDGNYRYNDYYRACIRGEQFMRSLKKKGVAKHGTKNWEVKTCYECEAKVAELSPRSRCVTCEHRRAIFNEDCYEQSRKEAIEEHMKHKLLQRCARLFIKRMEKYVPAMNALVYEEWQKAYCDAKEMPDEVH